MAVQQQPQVDLRNQWEYDVQTKVSNINGRYAAKEVNHGRPVFQMTSGGSPENSEPPKIYYWDERDGAASRGWWIGIGVGGKHVWAHNESADGTPPAQGWKIPFNGGVDPSAAVNPVAPGASSPMQAGQKRPFDGQYEDPKRQGWDQSASGWGQQGGWQESGGWNQQQQQQQYGKGSAGDWNQSQGGWNQSGKGKAGDWNQGGKQGGKGSATSWSDASWNYQQQQQAKAAEEAALKQKEEEIAKKINEEVAKATTELTSLVENALSMTK